MIECGFLTGQGYVKGLWVTQKMKSLQEVGGVFEGAGRFLSRKGLGKDVKKKQQCSCLVPDTVGTGMIFLGVTEVS